MTDWKKMAEELAERFAYWVSGREVRECVSSLRSADVWEVCERKGSHRIKPYPMGFYPDDPNLYYARGWGMHVRMHPLERWLVRTTLTRFHTMKEAEHDEG